MLGAFVLLTGAAVVLTGCSTGVGTGSAAASDAQSAAASPSAPSADAAATTSVPVTPTPAAKPVHVSAYPGDGTTVGVGMPIIATFRVKVTDGTAFAAATKVTVGDAPVSGAWFFEYSDPASGHVMEAHYRPQHYWPAHATIHLDLPVKGLSAGPGLAFDNSLTLDFATGSANLATVDDATHQLSLTIDGRHLGTYPVSLGARDTPTARGIKVIMDKGAAICMSGPGYHECGVKWTQRLTYGGEYLHAAPWNLGNLGRADSSNGCTNLSTAAAKKLYDLLRIGDVVNYPNANGPRMQLGTGYGDWNVPWPQWLTGGLVPTT
jgi:lipoprotein-anchoring transpeptidase ErfK/SrfK